MSLVCRVVDIPCPGSQEFMVGEEKIFIVRKEDSITAFINRCPHTGAPLNWQPDQFLDINNQYIQCSLHMAIFDAQSGQCISGPCVGDRLQPVEIKVQKDKIFLVR